MRDDKNRLVKLAANASLHAPAYPLPLNARPVGGNVEKKEKEEEEHLKDGGLSLPPVPRKEDGGGKGGKVDKGEKDEEKEQKNDKRNGQDKDKGGGSGGDDEEEDEVDAKAKQKEAEDKMLRERADHARKDDEHRALKGGKPWDDEFYEASNCSKAFVLPPGAKLPKDWPRLPVVNPLPKPPSIKVFCAGVGTTATTTIHRTFCQHRIPSSHWGWSCNLNQEDPAELSMHRWIDDWMTPLLMLTENNPRLVDAMNKGKMQKSPPEKVLQTALTGAGVYRFWGFQGLIV